MSYVVKIEDRAKRVWREKIPLPLYGALAEQLERLAADPVRLSAPSTFPYGDAGQTFYCRLPHGDAVFHVTVIFKYGSDEATLFVVAMSVQRVG